MRLVISRRPVPRSAPKTLAEHIESGIDDLLKLQAMANRSFRTPDQTNELIDSMNEIGYRLSRAGRHRS